MPELMLPDLPPDSKALLEKVVPPPFQPPLLYRAMGATPGALKGYAEGPILGLHGLLHTGQLTLTDSQVAATVTDQTPDLAWTPRQQTIMTIADAERVDFLAVASLHLGISALCSVPQIPSEPGTPTLPV